MQQISTLFERRIYYLLSSKRVETIGKVDVGRNTETLTRQKQLSNIRVKDLKGNWTHDMLRICK